MSCPRSVRIAMSPIRISSVFLPKHLTWCSYLLFLLSTPCHGCQLYSSDAIKQIDAAGFRQILTLAKAPYGSRGDEVSGELLESFYECCIHVFTMKLSSCNIFSGGDRALCRSSYLTLSEHAVRGYADSVGVMNTLTGIFQRFSVLGRLFANL